MQKALQERRERPEKKVQAFFYRTEAGGEPLREWLKNLPRWITRLIGEDIKTCELGWPVGMPTSRPLGDGLHEVRTNLPDGRISRVIFYIDQNQRMVLLHGFFKKTRGLPTADLALAKKNKAKHEGVLR
jgi:phage-related protein